MNIIWLRGTQKYIDFEAMGESKIYFFLFFAISIAKTWQALSFSTLNFRDVNISIAETQLNSQNTGAARAGQNQPFLRCASGGGPMDNGLCERAIKSFL